MALCILASWGQYWFKWALGNDTCCQFTILF